MPSGFSALNLHPQLQQAIDALGFSQMTPIQQKVLHFTLAGHGRHWSRPNGNR